jgi:hypothetical protein
MNLRLKNALHDFQIVLLYVIDEQIYYFLLLLCCHVNPIFIDPDEPV